MFSSPSSSKRWAHHTQKGEETDFLSEKVAILLSLYNGEKYLHEQLNSIVNQTYQNWVIFWRDDQSTDQSKFIIESFSKKYGKDKCIEISDIKDRLGVANSYLHLLKAIPSTPFIAFCDQDDVWHPQKLEWAITKIKSLHSKKPTLYCARQYLTNSNLDIISLSFSLKKKPSFSASLTQNIATGHTIVINTTARDIINLLPSPPSVLHDWWSYILVSYFDGNIIFDDKFVSHYRQHNNNAIGARSSILQRGIKALQRGPKIFMNIFNKNIHVLLFSGLNTPIKNKKILYSIHSSNSFFQKIIILLKNNELRRQTIYENIIFFIWFLLSKK
ncbi:glycosyltransferase family 2 protein [Swingsia samuiensis]|uniref:Glycosyltransferase family 2 protein n=1 Tax=Swingsia samuiensis TaxID=1293412 RepID=A0A4Y6UKI7_9PROT|nr:glycosyltransferase family 2 protein [Swingsia samuiensis]QDH16897.1 glycosyltransferase family 2 protein [Swingsia samuiensis]